MASVLKTEDLQGSGGSNPSPSAKTRGSHSGVPCFAVRNENHAQRKGWRERILHLRVVRAKRDFTGVFLLVGAYLNHKLYFETGFRS